MSLSGLAPHIKINEQVRTRASYWPSLTLPLCCSVRYLFDVAPYSLCVTLQLPLLVTSPQLKQLVRPAVERSVQELLPPVVERSIKIALTTCEQIVKKVSQSAPERFHT